MSIPFHPPDSLLSFQMKQKRPGDYSLRTRVSRLPAGAKQNKKTPKQNKPKYFACLICQNASLAKVLSYWWHKKRRVEQLFRPVPVPVWCRFGSQHCRRRGDTFPSDSGWGILYKGYYGYFRESPPPCHLRFAPLTRGPDYSTGRYEVAPPLHTGYRTQ